MTNHISNSAKSVYLVVLVFCSVTRLSEAQSVEKPLFREFMGLNGHTIQFKPALYAPAVHSVRDYHPVDWDLGDSTSFNTPFPLARNGVDWAKVYGEWKSSGFETEVCLMLANVPAKSWKDMPKNAEAYGKAFAEAFGPSSASRLVTSVEIGNEPGHYSDSEYRTVFESMAKGLRKGDLKLKIGTCALTLGKSEKYSKSVRRLEGLNSLYDFLNIHTYAEVEGYPTWKRSYPEDTTIDYLHRVEKLIAWRDKNAPGKEVRITEFGWDASTKKPPATGDFAKWVGSTEREQALYLVRSFLLFSKLDVTRAFLFFFDDKDEPHVHGSSGLTRKGQPKPAFHAVAHLQKTLGDYRFRKVLQAEPAGVFVYEYIHGSDPTKCAWAVWSAEASGKLELALGGREFQGAEQTPLSEGKAPLVYPTIRGGKLELEFGDAPVFVRFSSKK